MPYHANAHVSKDLAPREPHSDAKRNILAIRFRLQKRGNPQLVIHLLILIVNEFGYSSMMGMDV